MDAKPNSPPLTRKHFDVVVLMRDRYVLHRRNNLAWLSGPGDVIKTIHPHVPLRLIKHKLIQLQEVQNETEQWLLTPEGCQLACSVDRSRNNCQQKKCYATREEAERHCTTFLESYLCSICHNWHLTSGYAGKFAKVHKIVPKHLMERLAERKVKRRKRKETEHKEQEHQQQRKNRAYARTRVDFEQFLDE